MNVTRAPLSAVLLAVLAVLAVLPVLPVLAACAGAPPRAPVARVRVDSIEPRGADDAPVFLAPATFTVRKPERVVALRAVGEIHVGTADDANACRLVWSKDGLDRLVIFEARGCATLDAHERRLCFDRAAFTRAPLAGERADETPTSAPRTLRVDGCADENDLQWSKLQGASTLGVAQPKTYRARCAPVPQERKCALTYLRLTDAAIESNDAPRDGVTFTYSVDDARWRVCFLEKESGAYAFTLAIEDTCGHAVTARVAGDSRELDD